MEDIASVETCVNYSLLDRENNKITEAIEEVASGVFSAHFSNPDNDGIVIYLGGFCAGGPEAEEDDELNDLLEEVTWI